MGQTHTLGHSYQFTQKCAHKCCLQNGPSTLQCILTYCISHLDYYPSYMHSAEWSVLKAAEWFVQPKTLHLYWCSHGWVVIVETTWSMLNKTSVMLFSYINIGKPFLALCCKYFVLKVNSKLVNMITWGVLCVWISNHIFFYQFNYRPFPHNALYSKCCYI